MTDIALVWNPLMGRADIAMAGPDLQMDDGLETAVVISLFLDALAGPDDVIPGGDDDPRGWWGDLPLPTDPDYPTPNLTGSKFWLYERELQLPETLRKYESAARAALQWMIEDGVAGSVTALASYPRLGWIQLDITINRSNGLPFSTSYMFPVQNNTPAPSSTFDFSDPSDSGNLSLL